MTDDDRFAEVLARARSGEATAWSQLYHEVAPILIGYLRAQHLPDAEDVAGEVLLEVVRDIHRFEGPRERFRSWVLAIAHHRLLDARRRANRRPADPTPHEALDAPPSDDDPEADALATLGFGELEPALDTLTSDQRSVLLLRVIGDLPIAEVARITGRRPGAVKQLQRRATTALRRQLDAEASEASGEEASKARGAAPSPTTSSGEPTTQRAQPAHPVTPPPSPTLSECDGSHDAR